MSAIQFKLISEILPSGSNEGLYITLDLDWCHEEVLLDTIHLIEQYSAKATLFITNKLSCLNSFQNDPNFELGIHPNFNPLLHENDRTGGSVEQVIDELLNILPSARSVRSHSLVQSSRLTKLFFDKGITHESNMKIPIAASPTISPFIHQSGMIMCPYHWGDYSDMAVSFMSFSVLPNYFMVDFHPIHVFLNTESLDRYERTRPLHQNPRELIKHRYEGYGTRNRLIELLELAKQ